MDVQTAETGFGLNLKLNDGQRWDLRIDAAHTSLNDFIAASREQKIEVFSEADEENANDDKIFSVRIGNMLVVDEQDETPLMLGLLAQQPGPEL